MTSEARNRYSEGGGRAVQLWGRAGSDSRRNTAYFAAENHDISSVADGTAFAFKFWRTTNNPKG